MSTTSSAPVNVVRVPYQYELVTYPAPLDDWGYYEGRPTPALSPLMPFNTVPWWNRRWQYDKIQKPVYSTGNFEAFSNIQALRSKFVSKDPINKPTFIKDYHMIAIRKQIEQLFSPMFAAHLIVHVRDTVDIPPCYWIRHGRFQKSWWGHGADNGSILHPGHEHWFREGSPSGSLSAHMELSITNSAYKDWGGSVTGLKDGDDYRSSYGNYYILNIRYEWEVDEYWRKMVLEDWSTIRGDYMSIAPQFLMPHWGGWHMILQVGQSPTGRAIAFAIDMGQMWQQATHPNGDPAFTWNGTYGYPTTWESSPGVHSYTGPHYTSCSRPYKEGRVDAGSGGGSQNLAGAVQWSGEFKNIAGFNCGILTSDMIEVNPNDTPGFPSDITRPGRTWRKTETGWEEGPIYKEEDDKFPSANSIATLTYKKEGQDLEITPSEKTLAGSAGGASYSHVAHCKGAKITPKCYVTIMDLNGRVFQDIPVNDAEIYYQ